MTTGQSRRLSRKKVLIIVLITTHLLFGCSPVSPTPTPSPTSGVYYTVQEGDTIWDIAQLYGIPPKEIIEANNLSGPSIQEGQRLIIPRTGTPAPFIMHRVEPGETLDYISLLYGVSVDQIADYNGLSDPGSIYPGQPLYIPK
ncbi:MAG: hypothetical protein DRP01_10205 [Archaeoglobales archaeon]|nr:MAG: hypothetical protein DRP01_10205 [Archaeoglobales archaeon]